MSLNGGPVRIVDGTGLIEFTAQGGSYDKNGLAKRTLTGSISYDSPGGPKTVPLTAEYFVAKPSYQIETGTLPPLYLGCANKLSIQSPQLGALWSPNITADGAAVIQSGEKGKITVVPSAANVALNISNGGSLLGTERFRVSKVPRPTIEIFIGGTRALIRVVFRFRRPVASEYKLFLIQVSRLFHRMMPNSVRRGLPYHWYGVRDE